MRRRYIDLTGQKFGKLLVIEVANQSKNKEYLWKCICDCGKRKSILGSNLRKGHTRSCGCLKKEIASNFTHGMSYSHFYKKWVGIQIRVKYPNGNGAEKYIGIKCFWNTFEDFKNDMYESYLIHIKEFGEKNTTIDRIDNDGNYCKKNCRWATLKEQARNKQTNHFITFNKKTKCLKEWEEDTKIRAATIWHRIVIGKWSIEKALTIPTRHLTSYKKNV